MKFINSHPNYSSYTSDELFVAQTPEGFPEAIHSFLLARLPSDALRKQAINQMAGIIPTEKTRHWGGSFLENALGEYAAELVQKPLHKVMDFLALLATDLDYEVSAEDVNEFLDEFKVGYALVVVDDFGNYKWQLRVPVRPLAEVIEAIEEQVKPLCASTLEHLKQARKQLAADKTERGRKDVVRHCLSAMEALLKELSQNGSVRDATKHFVNSGNWGREAIVGDGLKIWEAMHKIYPDIRHGHPAVSKLPLQEAEYWVHRIMAFIQYLAAQESTS